MTATTTPALPVSAVTLIVTRGISSLGSALTTFGMNLWVFRDTGSYATFAYLAVLAALPCLLFAPFAGLVADRCNKKWLLFWCDLGSMLAVLLALLLAWRGAAGLSIPIVAATTLTLALASELRWSVLGATISLIVPRPHLGRINALQLSFRGITVMLGPVLGAVGFDALGILWLFALDVASYAIGIAGLLALRLPAPGGAGAEKPVFTGFWHELGFGFRWVFAHPGLRRLLLFFMAINVGVSVFTITFAPYVLSFGSNRMLGLSLGLQGAGAFLTGLLLARWRHQGAPEAMVLWGAAGFGLCMALWGVSRGPALLWGVAFLLGALATLIGASSQTIWQLHVPAPIQGKVFAVRTVFSFGLAPVAILGSVPLSRVVFAPLLHGSAGLEAVWGSAAGADLGLMVSTLGVGVAVYALVLAARNGFRLTEPLANVIS